MLMNNRYLLTTVSLTAMLTTAFAAREVSPPPTAIIAGASEKVSLPLSIRVDGSTTGFGGSVEWRFADHWGARAGIDGFGYSRSGAIKSVQYNASLRLLSEPVTIEFHPWKDHDFYFSAGIVFNQNEVSASASSNSGGTFTLDGVRYSVPSVGQISLKISQPVVNLYVGVGGTLLHIDPAEHWSVTWDAGVMYTGNPNVSLSRSGGTASASIDSSLAKERALVQNYADNIRWYPVIRMGIGYRF